MQGLGRLFDIGLGVTAVDINTSNAATGKLISLVNARGVTVLYHQAAAASGTDDMVLTFKQHTAYTGGTSNDLSTSAVATSQGITEWYIKEEATLDNDESWVKVTQATGATVTLTGTAYAASEQLVAVYIAADQLGDTYTHVSVNLACTTAAVRLTTVLYILHDLNIQRTPANLGNLLRPGAADA